MSNEEIVFALQVVDMICNTVIIVVGIKALGSAIVGGR
jgi:hypothetical protein